VARKAQAAQEKALSTRSIETVVYHTGRDPKEASETVQHIMAGCRIEAGTAYVERLNQVV